MGTYGSGIYGAGIYGSGVAGGGGGGGSGSVGPSLSYVVQDMYPDRVQLTAQGLTVGNVVTVSRRVAGTTEQVPVRGADAVVMTDTAMVVIDAENPYGVALTYTLTVNGVDVAEGSISTSVGAGTKAVADATGAILASMAPAVALTPPVWQSSTDTGSGAGTTIAPTLPSSLAANDIVLTQIYVEAAAPATTAPANWIQVAAILASDSTWTYELWAFRCVGGESGTVTFTFGASYTRRASMQRISGVVTVGNAVEVFNSAVSISDSLTTPTVELPNTTKDSLLVWNGVSQDGGTWTPPTGYTERSDNGQISVATMNNPGGEQPVTVTLAGGKVALSDAITGNSAEVVILSWPDKRRERNSSVFPVGGRNIVVAGQRGGFSGTIDIFTETDDSKNQVLRLLDTATSGVIQIRQPGPYDGVDAYVAVMADTEARWSQDGSDQRRVISLDVVETTSWSATLGRATFTLQDIADAYVGQTLADLADDYTILLALAQGDFS